MSKDGPPSGGIRYGWKQHQKAGVPFVRPTPNGEANLRMFLLKHPELALIAAERLRAKEPAGRVLECFRLEGRAGRFAVDYWRGSACEVWAHVEYSDDEQKLRTDIERDLRVGIYKGASLTRFNPNLPKDGDPSSQWEEVDTFLKTEPNSN